MSQLDTGTRRHGEIVGYMSCLRVMVFCLTASTFLGFDLQYVEAEWMETAKLVAEDTLPGSWAGAWWNSVGISGDTVIVGAPQPNRVGAGEAYIYQNNGSSWTQITELAASDGVERDLFGGAVAISGNLAVVSATRANSERGAVYVFENINSAWQQVAKLVADDGAGGDDFGSDVDIQGNQIIVGAVHDQDQGHFTGAAYVFENDGSGWAQSAKLVASDQAMFDGFGFSVEILGDSALVGAVDGDGNGSVYVFENNGSNWLEIDKLKASDAMADKGNFGFSMSMQEDRFVVTGSGVDAEGVLTSGAYVFDKTPQGWEETTKLLSSDGGGGFGISTALDGDTIVVGAYLDEDIAFKAGAAYVYEHDGLNWQEVEKLTATGGQELDRLGSSVAIEAGTIILSAQGDDQAGENAGAAYVFLQIPEPASLLLGMLGGLGLTLNRRRKSLKLK